ncbi:MAG: S-adenosylmethionine:tRNA ribosyltransferase-isomerase [Burkholderia sp.]|jgi:S-adenosylmethionine:tRNA ribosyltransferase-isomerase
MKELYLSDFDFELPKELIAQYPLKDRSASRLLHITTDVLEDLHFTDIERFLHEGDLLVANNTKVIKARLLGRKDTGGAVEALIERVTGPDTAIALVRASKSPKAGTVLHFADESGEKEEEVLCTGREGQFFELKFARSVFDVLEEFGRVPLPPYITHPAEKSDESRYQTVYAKYPGAVAAPTAGLHFTEELLKRLADKGVDIEYVTLHVGAGTFQPVRVEKISEHHMHSEWYRIEEPVAERINRAKAEGRRVIAVGTTSLRTLESAADRVGHVVAGARDTTLFVKPGFRFRIIDALITNFHLPKSTLVMLVSALVGRERILEAYRHAVEQKYRFFSYGDACYIENAHLAEKGEE